MAQSRLTAVEIQKSRQLKKLASLELDISESDRSLLEESDRSLFSNNSSKLQLPNILDTTCSQPTSDTQPPGVESAYYRHNPSRFSSTETPTDDDAESHIAASPLSIDIVR